MVRILILERSQDKNLVRLQKEALQEFDVQDFNNDVDFFKALGDEQGLILAIVHKACLPSSADPEDIGKFYDNVHWMFLSNEFVGNSNLEKLSLVNKDICESKSRFREMVRNLISVRWPNELLPN